MSTLPCTVSDFKQRVKEFSDASATMTCEEIKVTFDELLRSCPGEIEGWERAALIAILIESLRRCPLA